MDRPTATAHQRFEPKHRPLPNAHPDLPKSDFFCSILGDETGSPHPRRPAAARAVDARPAAHLPRRTRRDRQRRARRPRCGHVAIECASAATAARRHAVRGGTRRWRSMPVSSPIPSRRARRGETDARAARGRRSGEANPSPRRRASVASLSPRRRVAVPRAARRRRVPSSAGPPSRHFGQFRSVGPGVRAPLRRPPPRLLRRPCRCPTLPIFRSSR